MALTDAPDNGRPPAGEPRDWQGEAAEHEGQVTGLVGVLQAQLENEREALAAIEEVASGFRTRERRLSQALAALEGESTGRQPVTKPSHPSKSYEWTVRPETLERTRAALVKLGEARVSQVAAAARLSSETARRALEELRERDEARITRVEGRYGKHYAPMPVTGGPRAA